MSSKKNYFTLMALLIAGIVCIHSATAQAQQFRALIFSKTQGFRHQSVPDGVVALKKLASKHRFQVYATEDASVFTKESLSKYDVIIMMSTTGNIFDDAQKEAFQEFV